MLQHLALIGILVAVRAIHHRLRPPIDGSSIITPDWTAGIIIGLWDDAEALYPPPLLDAPGRGRNQ